MKRNLNIHIDKNRLSIKVAFLSVAMFSAQTFAWAVTPSAIDKAQALYATGDMVNALGAFETLLRAHPGDATAHYMKANCLSKLHRLPEAVAEYSAAERLAPQSRLAEYCRTARVQIALLTAPSSSKIKQVKPDENAESDDKAESDENPKSAADIKGQKGGKNSLPPGTLELIRKQAILARKHAIDVGQAEAEGELAKAENAAKSWREKYERAATHPRGSNEPVVLSPQETEAMRSQSAAAAEQYKQQGKMKAAIKEQESQEKSDEIEQQAENLQNQLLNNRPNRGGDVKLNPVGTNLYIRNYSKPPEVPLRAQASTATIQTKSTSAALKSRSQTHSLDGVGKVVSSGADATRPDGRAGGRTGTVVSVKGQLLPK